MVQRGRRMASVSVAVACALLLLSALVPYAQARGAKPAPKPMFSNAVAFDVSPPLSQLARDRVAPDEFGIDEQDDEDAPVDHGFSGDTVVQSSLPNPSIPSTNANFEGFSNQDNFNIFGGRVNPPDPVGDVGPNNYVEMVNLVFGVWNKSGNLLLGPVDTGTVWADFAIPDCTDPSGDPVVVYDQFADRWILSQFTTRGLDDPTLPFYNCVAVSTTGDPTGSYYRYAFITQADDIDGGYFFPDYPKYSVWTDSYVLTTRDFGLIDRYGVSVYALEKNKMINGNPNARAVQFFLEADVTPTGTVPLNLLGDGLLPADVDGKQKPPPHSPIPILGTQDDGAGYGGTVDALNVWEMSVLWNSKPTASIKLATQLPTAPFDSVFPCAPTSRDCLPEPGIVNPAQFLDILSYRQRPTYRLTYRNFKDHAALVASQSVEAAPGVAGERWYEIWHTNDGKTYPGTNLTYTIHQQGTFAPGDGVHRWMGSAAQDKKGDIALGYSVVNGVDVYPGIRYTGRLNGDSLGQMTLGEGTIINGTGVQTTTNSRWGDYTSMNVDPVDDCTFWYVNEYYTLAGQASSTAGWQTRIASFKLPGC